MAGSVRALSVLPADLPAAIERLQADGKDLRKQIKDFQSKLAVQEADALADAADAGRAREARLVAASLAGLGRGRTEDDRRAHRRASRVTSSFLVGEPAPAAIVVARSAGLPHDAGAAPRQLVERHGGKGGGRPEFAQGGGVTSPASDVLQSARELCLLKPKA